MSNPYDQSRRSFRPDATPMDERQRVFESFIDSEIKQIQDLATNGYDYISYLRDLEQFRQRKGNVQAAARIAVAEGAADLMANPITIKFMPYIFARRQFRVAQLLHGLKRDGNTVFVGCGLPEYEILALKMRLATPDSVQQVLGIDFKSAFNAKANRFEVLLRGRQFEELPRITEDDLYPGVSLAFDPNLNPSQSGPIIETLRLPADFYQFKSWTLGQYTDAVRTGNLDFTPDTIVCNRTDPSMYSEGFTSRRSLSKVVVNRHIAHTVNTAVEGLSPGGQMFVSVGIGNGGQERLNRTQLLEGLSSASKTVPGMRVSFTDPIMCGKDSYLQAPLLGKGEISGWGILGFATGTLK